MKIDSTGAVLLSDTRGNRRNYADQDTAFSQHALGRDVFVYFNNDGGGNAVRNALTLKEMVGV